MTAFAVWCKPTRLALVGLDLGYKDPKRSHVQGGWHDENSGIGHDYETGGRDHIPVPANFEESDGEIVSMAYYNNARINVEDALTKISANTQVFNLADGARIAGAIAMRSKSFDLDDFPEKSTDISSICAAFISDPGQLWEAYSSKGQQVLDDMVADLIEEVTLKEGFNWTEYSSALDRAWSVVLRKNVSKHRELRIEIYSKLVQDLLTDWYRLMLLTDTITDAEQLYELGLEELKSTLSTLKWPAELDKLQERGSPSIDQPTRNDASMESHEVL